MFTEKKKKKKGQFDSNSFSCKVIIRNLAAMILVVLAHTSQATDPGAR